MPLDYGIKIVEAGKAITSTDVRDLILSSLYPMFKFSSEHTAQVTFFAGATNGSYTINHGLGYTPAFISYTDLGDGSGEQRLMPFGVAGNPVLVNAFATSTQIKNRINQIALLSDRTYSFRTIIFKDKIV